MAHITLTEEQTRILLAAKSSVEIRGADGQFLMQYKPLTPEERTVVEKHRHRAPQSPGVPAEAVSALLAQALERDRAGGITDEEMAEMVRQMRANAQR